MSFRGRGILIAMSKIYGKKVLITGGASGIGLLVARSLAEKGAQCIVWDIDPLSLDRLRESAEADGLSIETMVCDISVREMVYSQAARVLERYGVIDILVNNAGVVSGSSFLDTPDEKIQKTMDVNIMAMFWTAKAFLPSMYAQRDGHLVTIASAASLVGVTGLADYSASKFAAFGFHEAIRTEIRKKKLSIRTTVVCPFFINTGMFDGVKTRFPLVLPILGSAYAARRIVRAIETGKKRLIMPRFVYLIYILRLLPVGVMDALSDFFGINNAMDEFRGREKS